MVNPISSIPSAQMPDIGQQVVDPQSGAATSLFHQFLRGLWQRTGGAAGVSSTDSAQVATAALAAANAADQTATLANASAIAAQTAAAVAQNAANTAQATADAAVGLGNSVATGALLIANNLGDLSNKATARTNLGVTLVDQTYCFDTCPAGLKRGVPLVQNLTMPANLAGTKVYAGVNAAADAVFTVSVFRGGALTTIGDVTFAAAGTGFVLSPQPAFTLFVGDVLVVTCPNPADTALAQVGITFPLTLT